MEHLYEKLREYGESDYYPYHMPGHKRILAGEMPRQMIQMDITEIEGFDNLHQPEGILNELQKKAAKLYGAEESFYLVNGSTGGILSAVSAALPVGGHLLMARNCHKSVYHAAYLRNLTISYLYPDYLMEYDICDAVSPKQVQEALEKEPGVGAVLLVSPSYEGRIADVEKIAKIVHEKGIPLIIDEAHGAHLGWADGFGKNSCECGADVVIHSVHKTLPALTQTALLHVSGNLIDRGRLRRFLHIYQTSSPSYLLMASIDNALSLMKKEGAELFDSFRRRYQEMLTRLETCRHLQFLQPKEGRQDIGKLVISAKEFGLSGQHLYEILLNRYKLQMEMAAGTYCLAMFTVGDGKEAYRRMTDALLEIDEYMEKGKIIPDIKMGEPAVKTTRMSYSITPSHVLNSPDSADDLSENDSDKKVISLGMAWDMPSEWLPLQQAVGRNVGDFINLYPPGTPLLVPGEILTQEKYRRIRFYLNHNLKVQGVERDNSINSIETIKVLRK